MELLHPLLRKLAHLLRIGLIANILLLSSVLQAGEFIVKEASAQLTETQLQSNAVFDLRLNNTVNEALHNGIPITLSTRLSLFRKRLLIWNENIATWQQKHVISYHSLSDRYQLNSSHSDGTRSYASIGEVLNQIESFSLTSELIRQTMPSSTRGYQLKLLIRLDIEALPPALRIVAYASSTWRIKSPARVWSIE
ncbi:MAG: hypothetical protein ACI9J2_002590 [Saprospiraceae bacterium]|jgi:hypothetical protein